MYCIKCEMKRAEKSISLLIFTILSQQGTANQNYTEISSYSSLNGKDQKTTGSRQTLMRIQGKGTLV